MIALCYKKIISILILSGLCWLFPIQLAYSQNAVVLSEAESLTHIGQNTTYLEDPGSTLKIADIVSGNYAGQFQKTKQDVPNFSSTGSAYWLKFDIQQQANEKFYLEVGTAFMDSISLFEFNEAGEMQSVRYGGDDLPFEHREVLIGNYLYELNIPQNATHTFYLRIKSKQPLFFPLRVGTLKEFTEYNHNQDYIQGIYFGFMLMIFFYNLFLYFKVRERLYLVYVTYVLSITWFMASIYGYFFEYFWPNAPWINQNVVVSSGLTMITATIFTRYFLELRKNKSWVNYGTYVFLAIGGLVCLTVIFGNKIIGLQLAQGGLLLMAIYYLGLGIYYKMKGRREATYYLIAWGFLLVGIIFALLESLNIIPVMPYLNAMQIGSGMEALLLSFALGEKIRTYKEQKEAALNMSLIAARKNEELIKEQNERLEHQVKIRTEEIVLQNKELVDLNEEKNNLISIVAHDLRNPLNQLKGFISLIKMDSTKLSDENKELLNMMHDSSERLTLMISRILDIKAIEAKELNLNLKKLNLSKLASQVVKGFELEAVNKHITIIEEHAEPVYCLADKDYLIQAIENLISNAIKFSPRSSEVTIKSRVAEGYAFIDVVDHGPGISDEEQQMLFKRYQRLSAIPTAGESSTGLGLSIVKKYVDAMNGEILCKSEIGAGSTFTIKLQSHED